MNKFHRKRDGTKINYILPIFLITVLITIFTSYGYAALNTKMSISGEAYVRKESDIRITGIRLISESNANETFQSKYSKNTITMGVNLTNNTSLVTYEFTVVNNAGEDYVIESITDLNSNANVRYTNTALEKTIIKANSTQNYRVTLQTNLTNQTTNLTLEFKFATDKVTPPVITGGSNNWSANNMTISIQTQGTATSGIKNYEYYVSDVLESPGDKVTGTTTSNVTISIEGTHYVFYRTVSNTGKKSSWSGYRITNIDKQTPILAMREAGNYEMSSTATIVSSATFGVGGGKTECVNVTTGSNTNIITFQNIKGFGKYEIKCTATGNNGKTATLSKIYAMGGVLNASYGLRCKDASSGAACTKSGTSWKVPAGGIQFGPYFQAIKGCYKVTYSGSGFNTSQDFRSYQNQPSIAYTILSKNITSANVTYYVNIAANTTGSGIEFVLRNDSTTAVTINSVKIESVSTCPAS